MEVKGSDYDLVYEEPLMAGESLESLYVKFNLEHPEDFRGHSMSVSDAVILKRDGDATDRKGTVREENRKETMTATIATGDTSDYSAGLSYPELVKAVKEKIDYDVLVSDYGDREVSIFPQLIAEMLYKCRDGRQIVVGNNTYQPEILKARYLEVGLQHIRHIMFLMQEEHISPRFVRNYYVQALYDAPVTMDAYYARRVDHDMNCGLLAAGA